MIPWPALIVTVKENVGGNLKKTSCYRGMQGHETKSDMQTNSAAT